jgi:hypothetical protein
MRIPGAGRLKLFDRKILQLVYGFDAWHVSKPFQRPYVRAIIQFINGLPPEQRDKICEIGSGLGDILRNVDAREKFFLEYDEKVLSACRFLAKIHNKGKAARNVFLNFCFPKNNLTERYNIIVMVNWIHAIDGGTLNEQLIRYYNGHLSPGGFIMVDSVEAEFASYHHDFKEFEEETGIKKKQLGEDFIFGRRVWLLEKPC